jgi:hypothetical protein
MTPWQIITGFGLDDWIYWHIPIKFVLITINYNNLQKSSAKFFFLDCRGFAPFSFSFYDRLLIYDWTTYIASRRIHRKHLFLYCCIYSALHSNGINPLVDYASFAAWMCLATHCLACLDAVIVGSNPTQGMDVWCVYAFILCLYSPVLR